MLKKIFISVGQYFLFLKMVFRKPEKWKIFYSCFKMSLFCFLISSIAAFNGVQVLKDINVTYEPGKCNMIIGAIGSGKTVLLKNLIGLLEPDSGEISYAEQQFTTMTYEQKKALRQNIGVLFQGSALFDFATAIENVMFPMEFFTDWSPAQRRERAQYCLELRDFVCANTLARNIIEGKGI